MWFLILSAKFFKGLWLIVIYWLSNALFLDNFLIHWLSNKLIWDCILMVLLYLRFILELNCLSLMLYRFMKLYCLSLLFNLLFAHWIVVIFIIILIPVASFLILIWLFNRVFDRLTQLIIIHQFLCIPLSYHHFHLLLLLLLLMLIVIIVILSFMIVITIIKTCFMLINIKTSFMLIIFTFFSFFLILLISRLGITLFNCSFFSICALFFGFLFQLV